MLNNMTTEIKHSGIVDEIIGDCVKVRIVQSSACASCKIAGHCNASESKEKIVDVYDRGAGRLAVGDSVVVIASQRMGYFAVMLSSVIPLFVLIAVLAIVLAVTGNEVAAAVSSLCSLLPYYLVLYAFRYKIKTRLPFRVERV